jgi:hypothetical protein
VHGMCTACARHVHVHVHVHVHAHVHVHHRVHHTVPYSKTAHSKVLLGPPISGSPLRVQHRPSTSCMPAP